MNTKYSKKSKYGSRKVTIDGVTYDSVKEYHRACELKLLERAGVISGLKRQVEYVLIPTQRIDGMVVERKCSYYADFVYWKDGQLVVEDVKGYRDPASAAYAKFTIKRKLMLYVYGIRISEV